MVSATAGILRHFLPKWGAICSDTFVLEYVKGYKIPFHSIPHQSIIPREPTFSKPEGAVLRSELDRLENIGAIERCVPCQDQYISSYFLVDKQNGKKRFILNLKKLNKFIQTPHFKLEDMRTVMKLVSQDAFMYKLDMKDAYFLVPVHPNYRKYLRFWVGGNLFELTCLPFGLSTSPYVFTKVMRPVISGLRALYPPSTSMIFYALHPSLRSAGKTQIKLPSCCPL